MSRNGKSSVEDLLYKAFFIIDGEDKRLVYIFGCDTEIQQRLSPSGKPEKKYVSAIYILDVTKTIEEGIAIIESFIVSDPKKFRANIEIVDPDEHMEQLALAHTILHSEMAGLANRIQSYGQALITLKHIAGNSPKNKGRGNLVLGTEGSPLASIFYNTVTGDVARLEREEVEQVGGVIMQVIMSHLSTDLDDAEELRRLKAEIEYKLVDSLPNHIKAGNVHINMESIVDEIRKYQGGPRNPDQQNNGE